MITGCYPRIVRVDYQVDRLGPKWTSTASDEQAQQYLLSFYKRLGASPESWSSVTSQYGDSNGGPAFGSSVFAGSFNDTSTPPNPVTAEALGTEAANVLSDFSISNTNEAQIVIATQSGTCYEDESGVGLFAGNCGKEQTTGNNRLHCGYHSYDVNSTNSSIFLPWVALPYQPDAKQECGQNFVNPSGTFDGFSMVGGHEYAETITDPEISAWYDANEIKGNDSKCVEDTSGRTTTGNKVQSWTCNGGTAQRITFTASRQLQVVGRCITGGNTAYLMPCSSATNENWTRLSNGEYVLKSNGRCLAEASTTNGKQLAMDACKNTATQHWSLP